MLLRFAMKAVIVSLFLSQPLSASELLNVGLRVSLKYDTFGEGCHLRSLFRHYNLSLEMVDQQISRARLTKLNVSRPDVAFDLTPSDFVSIDVRTEENTSWIKSFSASPALIKKFLNTADGLGRSDSCKPHEDLVLDELDPIQFDFGVEEVGYLLPYLIDSKPALIRGKRANGDAYQIELTITQDRT